MMEYEESADAALVLDPALVIGGLVFVEDLLDSLQHLVARGLVEV